LVKNLFFCRKCEFLFKNSQNPVGQIYAPCNKNFLEKLLKKRMQKSQLSKARWPRQMRTSTSVRSVAKVKSVRRYLVATLFVNHAQNVLCKRKNAPCAAKRRKDIKIFIFRNIVNTEISNKKNTFKSSFTFALFNTIIFRHFLSFTSRSSDLPKIAHKN